MELQFMITALEGDFLNKVFLHESLEKKAACSSLAAEGLLQEPIAQGESGMAT
jgi:hypothetical protein